jgi:putative spermidine/putrescine transport system ATP-binding protein
VSASLRLDGVTKRYGEHFAANDVSLDIAAGQFVTLLGPSGSGKTTLLMLIAGFVRPTSGRVLADDLDITEQPPERRQFGMVFQGYALFPNMTVADNLAFPLKLRKMPPAALKHEVGRMLEVVQLSGLERRYPRELSGGQQQRVALARALIFKPKVLLLDESLSALDTKLRVGLQEELRDLHARLGTTFVFVTHDQQEAMSMSDEIVIVDHGRVIQRGAPKSLYDRPTSRFVADFLGRANFIAGVIEARDNECFTYRAEGFQFRHRISRADLILEPGRALLLVIRPEKIRLTGENPTASANCLPGEIASVTYEGARYHVRTTTPIGPMEVALAAGTSEREPARGDKVWLSWDDDAAAAVRDDR